jgi:aspartate/methionine/tyrosine aminotransferase
VRRLLEVRKHAGLIVPAPVQAAMAAALDDDEHVDAQRRIYGERRTLLQAALESAGWCIDHSEGGLYLWVTHPLHDSWSRWSTSPRPASSSPPATSTAPPGAATSESP